MKLNYGQQQWMVGYVAEGLRKLGIEVTPKAVEEGLAACAALRTAAQHDPLISDGLNSYGPAVAARRAAEATPESIFADRFKASRLRALAAERAESAARRAAGSRRSPTAAQMPTPPDPYAAGIKALRESW